MGFFFTDDPPTRTPVGLRLGSETIAIAAGDAHYEIKDRYVLPVDVEVLAIQPHAHNLGRLMEAAALLPDGTARPLITIKDWDFRWQDVYRYAKPFVLPTRHGDFDAVHLRQLDRQSPEPGTAAAAGGVGTKHDG